MHELLGISTPEKNHLTTYLEQLKMRHKTVVEQSFLFSLTSLKSSLFKLSSEPFRVREVPRGYDHYYLPSTVLMLRTMGILQNIRDALIGTPTTVTTQNYSFVIEKLSNDVVSLTFQRFDGLEEKFQEILQKLTNLPLARAIQNALTKIESGAIEGSSSIDFTFEEDIVTTSAILENIGFFGYFVLNSLYSSETELDKILKEKVNDIIKKKAVSDHNSTLTFSVSLTEGITLIFSQFTNESGAQRWRVKVVKDLAPLMSETANQSTSAKCEAFIYRNTGRELIQALEQCELRFSSDFECFVTTHQSNNFDDRFGGAYTQLSRVLAKVVWSNDLDKIGDVFITSSGGRPTRDQLVLLSSHQSTDNGVKHLLYILSQILNRQSFEGDVETSQSSLSIQHGACFDVATYYCSALEMRQLSELIIDQKKFIYKTHGAKTLINIDSVQFNGITLPPGSLFILNRDERLAFLRLTPFMFDSREDMISAFGSEVIKAEVSGHDLTKIMKSFQSNTSP